MKKKKKSDFSINLKGCRQHNLKNLSLSIPKYAITAITGVSGSGKSSLAFDTLYAEGQRRYLANLSTEARSLIKQIPKPEVDLVEGLAPTLAICQGRQALYPRGIVATYTEIYDFLSLLFANIGEQFSPSTGKRLIRHTRQEIIELLIKTLPHGTRFQLLAPIKLIRENAQQAITRLQQMGFVRFKIQGEEYSGEEDLPDMNEINSLDVIVDRLEAKEDIRDRLAHSIETAMDLSQGILKVQEGRTGPIQWLTEIYICPETGHSFAPLQVNDFNFNSPHGACPTCKGLGGQEMVDPSLLTWDPELAASKQIKFIFDHLPKKISSMWLPILQAFFEYFHLSEKTPLKDIPQLVWQQLLYGTTESRSFSKLIGTQTEHIQTPWKGLIPLLNQALKDKKTKGSLNNLPFVNWQICVSCQGGRLKPESLACLIQGKNIHELSALSVSALLNEIHSWILFGKHAQIAGEIIPSIETRLRFLEQVGLGYLELNRPGNTLSDGEAQRIQLASQIGAKLSGIIYILDEPSLGLHRKDVQHLQQVIQELKSLDNTVILVEHERTLITEADHLIELGPGAGMHGGELLFEGSYQEILKDSSSPTGRWLSGEETLPKPPKRKNIKNWLTVISANMHNLRDFSIKIPLGCLVGFCGVSGSGKSTLVIDLIGAQIRQALARSQPIPGIKGTASIQRLVLSEKQAERFSVRSIPATYVGIMTPLRQLFAETRLAKARGYTASRFSLNKRGGRCEACEGLGQIRVNMQLMSDLYIPCEVCQGLRYNHETCQITWENLNIAQVLELSVEEAAKVFSPIPSLASKLELMRDLGLDYLTLGQPFNTLSSGEIQRLRLAADLADPSLLPTLYILDEPSAGLHFQDIRKLVTIMHRLVEKGHSIFLIEHHLDILRQADWLIELGPGPGPEGGKLIYEGTLDKFFNASTPTSIVMRK
jgi:excinuclease ABC subunit A